MAETSAAPLLRAGRPEDVAGLHALGEAVVPATYASTDPACAEMMRREP